MFGKCSLEGFSEHRKCSIATQQPNFRKFDSTLTTQNDDGKCVTQQINKTQACQLRPNPSVFFLYQTWSKIDNICLVPYNLTTVDVNLSWCADSTSTIKKFKIMIVNRSLESR